MQLAHKKITSLKQSTERKITSDLALCTELFDLEQDLELFSNRTNELIDYAQLVEYLDNNYNVILDSNTNMQKNNSVKFETSIQLDVPYLGCRVYEYSPLDAKACINRVNGESEKIFTIVIVGDSIGRILARGFIENFDEQFHFKSKNIDIEVFLKDNIQKNIFFIGEGIHLHFYWAPYLDEAKNQFLKWLNATLPIPDVIIISIGMWSLTRHAYDRAVDIYLAMLNRLSPIINQLTRKTRVVWLVIPERKTWLMNGYYAKKLQHRFHFPLGSDPIKSMLIFLTRRKLQEANINFWNSLNPIIMKESNECERLSTLLPYENWNLPKKWNCYDSTHGGQRTKAVAINMLWNYVCNDITGKKDSYCCVKKLLRQ